MKSICNHWKKILLCALVGGLTAVTISPTNPTRLPDSVLSEAKVAKSLASTVRVTIDESDGFGTGIILHKFGQTYIITAAHVTEHANKTNAIFVQLQGSTNTYLTKIVNEDRPLDLALLRVLGTTHQLGQSITFGDYINPLPIGTQVFHVGHWAEDNSFSFSEGIVGAHNRLNYGSVFDQISATIFSGSSGGGVFDSNGNLVGIALRSYHSDWSYMAPSRLMFIWARNNDLYWIFL
jgi:S1-C subfamily serine protease